MEAQTLTALVGGIQKFSTDDGPGIRTTVFLKGCPLRCRWCHNPELISFSQQIIRMPNSCIHCGYCAAHCPEGAIFVNDDGEIDLDRALCTDCMRCVEGCFAEGLRCVARRMTPEEVLREVVQDKRFYEETGGGMTISGGELLSQADFAGALVRLAAAEGIRVCLDTSGFGDGAALLALARAENVTDILYDMKCIDPARHRALTGQDNAPILENLALLAADDATRRKIHLRMPLVRGLNDDLPLMEQTAAFCLAHGLERVTLLPYHALGVSKARHVGGAQERFEPPEDAHTQAIRALFEQKAHMVAEISGIAR